MRQLRRLQNYYLWSKNNFGICASQDWVHGLFLWRSVLKAAGFGLSFQAWWRGRECLGFSDPGFVPDFPPSPDCAWALCETFCCEVRCLERTFKASQRTTRACAHDRDPNLIYKDTKRPVPEPVTSLLHTCSAKVTAVDLEDMAVEFELAMDFDAAQPVLLGNRPSAVIHATDTKLYLEDVQPDDQDKQLSQSQPVGAVDALFDAFHLAVPLVSSR